MKRRIAASLVAIFTAVLPAAAQSQIEITVHTAAGDKVHTAPTLGQLPLSIEEAMQAAGMAYTATWFASTPGYAAMIIDGEPSQTSGKFGGPFWWACVNGFSSAAGLQTLVKAGDHIEWSWVTDGKCPQDTAH